MNEICGALWFGGPNREPLACGFPKGHAEGENATTHSWATLPTFGSNEPAAEIASLKQYLDDHQKIQRWQHGGSTVDKVKGVIREYEDKAAKAHGDAKQIRSDYLTYFRALIIVLEMAGHADTHKEKNARLRGAIEILESMIQKLRYSDLGALLSDYRWPDVFRSDWPQQRLLERIHDLESQLAAHTPELPSAQDSPESENIPW